MDTIRYNFVRKELIRLYHMFTEEHFLVIIPKTSFMSLKQLEYYKENPPIIGFESLEVPEERPYSIAKFLEVFKHMGDDAQIFFRYPAKDIPRIYDSVQDWIRYWVEIKRGAGYLRTPSVQELELVEKLARHLFTDYAHYHYNTMFDNLNVKSVENMTLLDALKGRMMYGTDLDEGLSYISYLDEYKTQIGYRGNSMSDVYSGLGGGM